MPKCVPLQTYKVGLKLHQILFFMQYMSREIIRAHRANPSDLLNQEPGYLTIREAEVYYPENGRTVLITTQICIDRHGPFAADSIEGTYQVGQDHEKEPALRSATSDDVQRYLDDVATLSWYMVYPKEKRTVYQITDLPVIFYDPPLHGRFLYTDQHNFDPNFSVNRAIVGAAKWKSLSLEHRDLSRDDRFDGAVIAINQWCEQNCSEPYAWIGAGPIWAFTSPNDAFLFRIMWG